VKVEENTETPNLLSFPIRFVCGISHMGVNYSTNLAINLTGVLYFGIFLKKLYLLYIGTDGVLSYIDLEYINCISEFVLQNSFISYIFILKLWICCKSKIVDDDNYPEFPEYGDTFMRETEGKPEGGSEGGAEGEAHDKPP
jgi:hypothetical protein